MYMLGKTSRKSTWPPRLDDFEKVLTAKSVRMMPCIPTELWAFRKGVSSSKDERIKKKAEAEKKQWRTMGNERGREEWMKQEN